MSLSAETCHKIAIIILFEITFICNFYLLAIQTFQKCLFFPIFQLAKIIGK